MREKWPKKSAGREVLDLPFTPTGNTPLGGGVLR
ncbi:hypothetical protein HNQ04_004210 [Deinococcus radiopugnans ATCC 19172]|uniref:Uncharacterized protein n=1 Tax=Deinococcus radiopugnans ATCC 19172 TaxID=585398 RepID=A0ABR6NY09_9DEIO|nr:hypothetical protein [Deinococcus radiopugnans ATCC 19172]